ncbi:hypothetical protein MAR_020953, partial [Mya arenaria]
WGYTQNLSELAKLDAELDEDLNTQLQNKTTYATEFVQFISTFIENKTLNSLREKKLTLFLDESTDNSNRSQASLMARWVDERCVFVEYIGLIELKETKAVDFEEAVSIFFNEKGWR